MSSFIAVEKGHFESLLLRASTQHVTLDNSPDSVTISNAEYAHLLEISTHFSKLKGSLLKGGLAEDTLNVLIYGTSPVSNDLPNGAAGRQTPASHSDKSFKPRSRNYHRNTFNNHHNHSEELDDEDEIDETLLQESDEKEEYGESSRSDGTSPPPVDQRTVLLRCLPDKVTHKDITQAVHGGALLHIYLRERERAASISFVEEAEAQEFLQHSKTHGLYVAGKRVEVQWNDRQFYLPPYVRTKINSGASRNLVIYNVHPKVTETHIRRDLDHIHNLIVIAVKFKMGNAYISTNSVHNALFARSCMMSRFTYKGMRIGFSPDECAEPLPRAAIGLRKEAQTPAKKSASLPNRFHLLSLDGAGDESDGLGGMNGLPLAHWLTAA